MNAIDWNWLLASARSDQMIAAGLQVSHRFPVSALEQANRNSV
jgi:hypothetical protein